jgi:hypothetical protein
VGNNSGNQIGRGFEHFLHVVGGGNAIILADAPNGDLTWFRYTGAGEQDPTGTNGFRGENNPANVIGNGFHTFRHLFVSPREGQTTATTIFAVAESGDLLWFQYSGHGEQDPTGVLDIPRFDVVKLLVGGGGPKRCVRRRAFGVGGIRGGGRRAGWRGRAGRGCG